MRTTEHHAPDSIARGATRDRAAAKKAGLKYVNDSTLGIRRESRGRAFRYAAPNGNVIRDPKTLARIGALVIPPGWTDVWICSDPDGHMQVTGRDARGRKQYRYHARWREVRDESKYAKLIS